MPEIILFSLELGGQTFWVAFVLNDRRQVQHICTAEYPETARAKVLESITNA